MNSSSDPRPDKVQAREESVGFYSTVLSAGKRLANNERTDSDRTLCDETQIRFFLNLRSPAIRTCAWCPSVAVLRREAA